MRRFVSAVLALILCLSFSGAAEAQQPGARGSGFFPEPSSSGDVNATYLTLGTSGVLNNERVLTPNATYFAVTDNGPGGTYQITLNTLPIAIGGSGATTAQGAVNNYLDGIAGAAAASGDIIYRNGSTWTRLAKGADGTFLTLASGLPSWGSSPAGAPADAEYVTLSSNAGLSNEVVLTAGTGISIGAGTATIAINSTVTTNSGSQTLTNKTLTSPIFSWNGGAGVQFNGSASNHLTFTWADWAGARAISVPDPGTTSATQVLLNRGNQTINGVMTFTGVPVISQITNTGTLTLPTSTDTLIGRATTDTLTNKTITSPIMSASIVLDQTTQDYTISWANPAAARAYEIRDVGADADFAMTHATATYTNGGLAYVGSGVINFTAAGTSGQTIISAGTSAPSWGTLGPGGGGTGITSYTAGDLLTVNDAGTLVKLAGGSNGNVLTYNTANDPNVGWAAPATNGTVTSVALTVPSILSVSGSPVTTSGTLAVSLATQTANIVFAGPSSGGAATPTFRSLVADDLPTVTTAKGGTNITSYTAGDILVVNDSGALVKLALGSNGHVLTVDTGLNPKIKWAAASAGSNSFTISTKTSSFTASDGANYYYRMTTNDQTVTLPASPADGSVRAFKMVTAAKTATFACNGVEVVNRADGSTDAAPTLTSTQGVMFLMAVTGGWDEI